MRFADHPMGLSVRCGRWSKNIGVRFLHVKTPFICYLRPCAHPFVGRSSPSVITTTNRGFSLIELIIVLVIVGVVLALAAPAMRTFVQNQRISGQVNDLLTDLNLARSESIKRTVGVGICSSANCGAPSTNWESGWSVFVDSDSGNDWDAGEPVLRVRDAIGSGNTLRVTPAASSAPLIFLPNGKVSPANGRTYSLCDIRGPASGRRVIINSAGQIRMMLGATTCS